MLAGRILRWSGGSSTASTTASLGDMVQRRLGDGSLMMDVRRKEVLFGVVAASTAGHTRLLHRSLLKMGSWKTAAATSQRVQWCVLSGGWTGWCSQRAVGRLDEPTGFR